jgi:broad specificity polyphosphatase/5'/3'-nucleotidase SurE
MDNNNGNDEDLDEEVELVYEEEEEEEEGNEEEEYAAEEVQTEHINVTPNKKGKLKTTKQVTKKQQLKGKQQSRQLKIFTAPNWSPMKKKKPKN